MMMNETCSTRRNEMTEPQKILEALKSLEVQNDDHWTANGAPSLTEISKLVGENVKRKDVTEVAPMFTRERAQAGFDPDSTEPSPDSETLSGISTEEQAQAAARAALLSPPEELSEANQDETEQETPKVDVAKIQARLEIVNKELVEANKTKAVAINAADKLQQERDRLLNSLENEGQDPLHKCVNQYLRTQQLQRERRAANRPLVEDLRKAGIFDRKSKLDEVMARHTGFGTKRPQIKTMG
jgi:hypothetical protein